MSLQAKKTTLTPAQRKFVEAVRIDPENAKSHFLRIFRNKGSLKGAALAKAIRELLAKPHVRAALDEARPAPLPPPAPGEEGNATASMAREIYDGAMAEGNFQAAATAARLLAQVTGTLDRKSAETARPVGELEDVELARELADKLFQLAGAGGIKPPDVLTD